MTLPHFPCNWVQHENRNIMAMTDADTDLVGRLLQYLQSTWQNSLFPLQLWNVFGDEMKTNKSRGLAPFF